MCDGAGRSTYAARNVSLPLVPRRVLRLDSDILVKPRVAVAPLGPPGPRVERDGLRAVLGDGDVFEHVEDDITEAQALIFFRNNEVVLIELNISDAVRVRGATH